MDEEPRVLEFRIPADTRYVSLVRRGIRTLGESAGFRREEVADVEVAVSEAVTNSVTHGSPRPDESAVVVKCRASCECLVVEVEDAGAAHSLPPLPDATDPECERTREGGRGVLVMHALMDEIEGSRTERGMLVRMAKQRK